MTLSKELRQRIASGMMLVAIAASLTLWCEESFIAMCMVGSFVLVREWYMLTKHRSMALQLLGIVYSSIACGSLIYLRIVNLNILLATLAIVITGDVAAYVVGKKYGRHKIAPSISPGKSWEGLAGSILASALIAAILGRVAPLPHAILGAVFAVIGLGGDLFESSLKRHAGVKDSGRLIPGHGGLFDRVDALLPCAIFSAAALYIRTNLQ